MTIERFKRVCRHGDCKKAFKCYGDCKERCRLKKPAYCTCPECVKKSTDSYRTCMVRRGVKPKEPWSVS